MTEVSRRLRVPYSNKLAAYQHQKPVDGLSEKANVESKRLTDKTSSKYEWNQCFGISSRVGDSGAADETACWRCADCGAPAESESQSCCSRCGSCLPVEYR